MTTQGKPGFRFSYSERLHRQKDFKNVHDLGRRVVHPAIFIYKYVRKDGPDKARLGLSTSKKIGSAPVRNRVKRRLREIFRLNKNAFVPKLDLLFVPRKDSAGLSYSELSSIVLSSLKKSGAFRDPEAG